MSTIDPGIKLGNTQNTLTGGGSGGSSEKITDEKSATYQGWDTSSLKTQADGFVSQATGVGSDAESKVQTYKAGIRSSGQALGNASRGLEGEKSSVSALNPSVDSNVSQKESLKNSYMSNKTEITRINKELDEKYNEANEKQLQDKIAALEKEVADNQQKIEKKQAEINSKQQQLNMIDPNTDPEKYQQLSNEIEQLKNGEDGLAKLQARNEALNGDDGELAQAKTELSQFQTQKGELQQSVQQLTAKNTDLAKQFQVASDSLKSASQALKKSSGNITQMKTTASDEESKTDKASEEQKKEGKTIETVGTGVEAGCNGAKGILSMIKSIVQAAKAAAGAKGGDTNTGAAGDTQAGGDMEIETPNLDTSFASENTASDAANGKEGENIADNDAKGEDKDKTKIKLNGGDVFSIIEGVLDVGAKVGGNVKDYGKAMQEDGFNQEAAIASLAGNIVGDASEFVGNTISTIASKIEGSDDKIDDDENNQSKEKPKQSDKTV